MVSETKRAPGGAPAQNILRIGLLLLYAFRVLNERTVGVDDVAVEGGCRSADDAGALERAVLAGRDDGIDLCGGRGGHSLVEEEVPVFAPAVSLRERLHIRR